ncbi:MAG TPA: flagellar basal-body MS-ring/collar protein FliF [Burkholderiales bacterium]|nr:flagellar basal-body MS-ring/collar protein FliF [Burkholderiales bacterium]
MADTGTSLMQPRAAFPATIGYSLRAIPAQRLFLMLLATAILVSLLVGLMLWSKDSDYRVLFTNISDRDGGQIIQALQQANVPYKFEGSGAIYVPSDQVHEMRLRLASQGLPRGGNVGFELMENQKFGMTQFQEQVNYQRALEGELSRSIQSLSAVQGARVHLAIPKPSVFLREQQKPSASVLLTLYPGRQLDRDQAGGIMHLVSSSVPDLPISAVSIIDQNGNLLSSNASGKPGSQLDAQQLAYVHQVEASYIKRVVDILEPIVGRDNVRVQVTADLDFSEIEATAETFKPNQNPAEAAIRSQQISENNNGTSAGAAGVPGALTNQPAPAATAPIIGSGAPPVGTSSGTQNNVSVRKDATTNYEVDKTVRHTRTPTGTIRRLSTAVVVNYKKPEAPATPAKATKGKAAPVPQPTAYSTEEIEKINALVKEAMGYTQTRGDSLNIANVPFNVPAAVSIEEPPLWKQPETVSLIKEFGKGLLVAGLLLVILLTVVKPLFKAIKNLPATAPAMMPMSEMGYEQPVQVTRYEDRLRATREIAKSDPKVVASVVRDWVSKDE